MAVFLLKTKYGSAYVPPPCTGVFDDVACPSQFADWIEELAAGADHRRLRRHQLLPHEPEHARPDGGVHRRRRSTSNDRPVPHRWICLWWSAQPAVKRSNNDGHTCARSLCSPPLRSASVVRGAATLTVTSTADSGPGTLHQALLDSNASVGVLDTIAFAIPGAGVHTIVVSTDLPAATDPVIIDGTTQPGYVDSPLIELTESTPTQGLRISGGGSTVRGLAIFEFGVQLTLISNGGNLVEACYIGINATATVTSSGQGIQIQNSPDTTIGGIDLRGRQRDLRNDRHGNPARRLGQHDHPGQHHRDGSDRSRGLGNDSGISVVNSDDVVIGGTVAGMGNLISGNDGRDHRHSGSANT